MIVHKITIMSKSRFYRHFAYWVGSKILNVFFLKEISHVYRKISQNKHNFPQQHKKHTQQQQQHSSSERQQLQTTSTDHRQVQKFVYKCFLLRKIPRGAVLYGTTAGKLFSLCGDQFSRYSTKIYKTTNTIHCPI